MINKPYANINIKSMEALNKPDWYEYNLTRVKTASIQKDKEDDYGGFDVSAAIKEKPEHLFIKIFAIKKDEVNDNGDAFSERELKKATPTFIGVPIFTNHQNTDIEKAKGKCVHAWYDDDAGGIFIIAMIDRVMYPPLARIIEEGIATGTSMGTSVESSLCSVCHHCSATADGYCDCIKHRKNKKFSGKIMCQYHKSKDKIDDDFYEKKCPICGCKEGEEKELFWKEAKIYEHNFNLKFIEDSLVVNPACHDCLVCDILNPSGMQRKIAEIVGKINGLQKVASSENCGIEKYAGQKEIQYLSDVMEKIEVVTKSMMAQKQQVSMEYVSDLVDVMASVQSVTDELIEMGYGQLPSPTTEETDKMELPQSNISTATPAPIQPVPRQPSVPQIPPTAQPNIQNLSPSVQTEQIGNIGNVTKPKFSEIDLKKKKEFLKVSDNLIERLKNIQDLLKKTDNTKNIDNKEFIAMENTKIGQENNSVEKTAASHDTSVIIEKQLENAKFTGERTGSPSAGITEKQLDNPTELKNPNVTKSDSPQERSGSPDTITEKQLTAAKSGSVVRWNDFPGVITEKQWTDMSRAIGSVLSEKQDSIITEKQLSDFLSHHRYISPAVITEKQMSDQKGELARWAYVYDANSLIKSAMQSISDVIAFYGKTPSEIVKAAAYINENAKNQEKASFLTLINALPHKAETRNNEKIRYNYLSKIASSNVETPSTVDSLITAMADHVGDLSSDDLVATIYHVATDKNAFARIEEMAKKKASKDISSTPAVDKVSELKKVLSSMNKEEDGMYQVKAKFADVVPARNKTEFLKNTYKTACRSVSENVGMPIKLAMINVEIDKKAKEIFADMKDVKNLTTEEKKAWNKIAKHFVDDKMDFNGLEDDDDDEIPEFIPEGEEEAPIQKQDIGIPSVDEASDIDLDDDFNFKPIEGEMNGDLDDNDKMMYLDNGDNEEVELDFEDGLEGEDEECPVCNCEPCNCEEHMSEEIKSPEADTEIVSLGSRKANREAMIKEAQLLGGEVGGQAGAATGPGAGATMPTAPGAAAGAPPVESFENSDLGGEFEEEPGDLKTKPPGAFCPVCKSDDVDIIRGTHKCNNCSASWTAKVKLEIDVPGITTDEGEEKNEKEEDGEGFEMPEAGLPAPTAGAAPAAPAAGGAAPGGMPAAASTNDGKVIKTAGVPVGVEAFALVGLITPKMLEVAKKANIKLASVSPITGTTNTMDLGKGNHLCLDTGSIYNVTYKYDKTDNKKIYAQFSWKPLVKKAECSACEQARINFAKSLKDMGIEESDFDTMGLKEKGDIIVAMKKAGALKTIKTASSKQDVLEGLKKMASGAIMGDKFPMETCLEKLARRYGQDAVALSGPCEGKPLADCVCKSLKSAGTYSNGLAVKVASIWGEKDGSIECLEDCVREGFDLKEASSICEAMKMKYASLEDALAQRFGEEMVESTPEVIEPPINEEVVEEEDPFEEENVAEGVMEGESTGIEGKLQQIINTLDEVKDAVQTETNEVEDVTNLGSPSPVAPSAEGEMKGMISPSSNEDLDSVGDEVIEKVVEDEIEEPEEGETIEHEESETPEQEAEEHENGEEPEDVMDEADEEIEEEDGKKENFFEKMKKYKNKEGVSDDDSEDIEEDNKEEVVDEGEQYKEGKENNMEYTEKEAQSMRKGYVGKTDEVSHLNLDKIFSVLNKKADKVKSSPAQDNVPFAYQDGKVIGDETKFKADKPDVPSKGDASKMGQETPPKADTATIPTSDARMGGEKDNKDLKPELDDTATGGEEGAGTSKAASSQSRINDLADRIIAAQTKMKRVAPQDNKDINPTGDSYIGNEKESIGDVPAAKSHPTSVPRGDAFIGNEKESIGEKPSEKDMPSIPTSDARIGGEKDNAKIAPEKENELMGVADATVTAQSKNSRKEATRLAGRMVQAGKITPDQLSDKIAELATYKVAQIKDLERGIFSEAKGLKTPSDGLERAVIISEKSNGLKVKASKEELTDALTDMFKLGRQVKIAQEDTDNKIRKEFRG